MNKKYYLISEKTGQFFGYYSIDKLAIDFWCRKSTIQNYAKSHKPFMGFIIGYGIFKQDSIQSNKEEQNKTEQAKPLF